MGRERLHAEGLTSTNLQSNETSLLSVLLIYEIILTKRMCDGNNYNVVIDHCHLMGSCHCTRNHAIIRNRKDVYNKIYFVRTETR